MTSSFLITLREGLEASLIVAILLTYLSKTDRKQDARYVWFGTASAVVACLIAGVAFFLGPVAPGVAPLADGKVAHAKGIIVAANSADDSLQIQPELIETAAGEEGTQLQPLYVNGHGAVAYDSRLAF